MCMTVTFFACDGRETRDRSTMGIGDGISSQLPSANGLSL
jgi:hypothetical protein